MDTPEHMVKVHEAKTHLSSLLADVQRGQEVVIARGGTPVARLVPYEKPRERELGFVAFSVPEEFYHPLPEQELTQWEQ